MNTPEVISVFATCLGLSAFGAIKLADYRGAVQRIAALERQNAKLNSLLNTLSPRDAADRSKEPGVSAAGDTEARDGVNFGPVAQWLEPILYKGQVDGSNPSRATTSHSR